MPGVSVAGLAQILHKGIATVGAHCACGMADTPCKRRRKACDWSVMEYTDFLEDAVKRTKRRGSLDTIFGPYARLSSQVTAATLVRNLSLVEAVFERGQTTCVLHSSRLEAAAASLLTTRPHLLSEGADFRRNAHDFTDHVMAIMRTIRTLRFEDDSTGGGRLCSSLILGGVAILEY